MDQADARGPGRDGAARPAVPFALMRMRWATLTFLHWRYDPAVVQRLVPRPLEVETYDGAAWVGLVPFAMTVTTGRGPAYPWLSHFPETNVRTYVRGPDGRGAVWFLSLDAARLPAVLAARAGWTLPYFWARMSVSCAGDLVRYRSRRRPGGQRGDATVYVGEPLGEASKLADFLTTRFALLAIRGGRVWRSEATHPRWPLHRAEPLQVRTDLVTAAGLPPPAGPPLTHFSPGVDVRIGPPRRIG